MFFLQTTYIQAQVLIYTILKRGLAGAAPFHSEKSTDAEDLPPGRLGGLSYFSGAEKKYDRVLVPDLGSLTSIYDRTRELFYYLKGGQVDYGEEHSKACGHSQFGRFYERGGAGGQHANTTDSVVRITHIPTGITHLLSE